MLKVGLEEVVWLSSGGSQLPETQSPGDPMACSGFQRCTHTSKNEKKIIFQTAQILSASAHSLQDGQPRLFLSSLKV